MLFPSAREVLADSTSQEEDHHHCRCDPEGAVEVGVAFEDVEEVLARVERCAAASEDLIGVDIEELLVEGYAPEKTLRGVLLVAWTGAEEGGGVWLHFGGARRWIVECCFQFVSDLCRTVQCNDHAYWKCGTRGCPPVGRYGRDHPNFCSAMIYWFFVFLAHTSASTSTTTSYPCLFAMLQLCAVCLKVLQRIARWVVGRAAWGDVVGEARAF